MEPVPPRALPKHRDDKDLTVSTRDPFETPPPHEGGWEPDSESADSRSWAGADGTVGGPPTPDPQGPGYAAPGYAAPGHAAPQQPAPGFSAAPPAPQQPAYGYQPQATAPSGQGGTDGPSIAALVTGILGLGVVAVVLGAIGLRRTAGGARKGTGMAVAGLVLGLLGTIVATAAITWSIAAASSIFDDDAWTGNTEQSETTYSEGGAYGDDPYLDGLWDDCAAGDDAACDDLYAESPLDSEYEEFGDSCGERGRPFLQMWCEEGRDL